MFRFFRFIRQRLLLEGKVLRYLKYAVGEIILVVIGILIALQINNANQKRIENEALWGYLSNIRSNIKNDLKQTTQINFIKDRLAANTPKFWELRAKEDFDYDDYRAAEDHMNTIGSVETFVPNSFGFETLKSTGYIGKLQGTDMEILLFNYYDFVEKIKTKLDRDRDFLNNLIMELQTNSSGITGEMGYMMSQDSLVFKQIKDLYVERLNSPIFDAAVSMHRFNEFYEMRYHIDFLGRSIISLIDDHTLNASPEIMRSVELLNTDFSGIGQEEVVINGIIPRSIAVYTNTNLGWEKIQVNPQEDHIEIKIDPDLEWAAALFVVDSLGQNLRASKDFTEYKSIELEARGETGDEQIYFTIKDKVDPDDGMEARVSLPLIQHWQRFRFDLRDNFPTANLKILHVVGGFVSLDPKGGKFYVRNIKYLKE